MFNHTGTSRAAPDCMKVKGKEKGAQGKLVIAKNICYELGHFSLFSSWLMCVCYFDSLLGTAYKKARISLKKISVQPEQDFFFSSRKKIQPVRNEE